MSKISVFIEGGLGKGTKAKQNTDYRDAQMRRGFNKIFLEAIKAKSNSQVAITIKLCGGRDQTFKEFRKALADSTDSFKVLLVDAEEEVTHKDTRNHLKNREGDKHWDFTGVDEDQCHLMVQTMEAWFLADQKALQQSFRQDFDPKKLKLSSKQNLEKVAKPDIMAKLTAATDGKYNDRSKLEYCGRILLALDPKTLQNLEHCKKLFEALVAHV